MRNKFLVHEAAAQRNQHRQYEKRCKKTHLFRKEKRIEKLSKTSRLICYAVTLILLIGLNKTCEQRRNLQTSTME